MLDVYDVKADLQSNLVSSVVIITKLLGKHGSIAPLIMVYFLKKQVWVSLID